MERPVAESDWSCYTLEFAPAATVRPAMAKHINMAWVGVKSDGRKNPAHGFGGTLVPLQIRVWIPRLD